ncbi:hypothetical protein C8R45DRAFT_1016680 [Mycena sanguinolenta]|nr:hypothetical protein C8R45DRAFT_1016680 [Mycena sanguinolenta]
MFSFSPGAISAAMDPLFVWTFTLSLDEDPNCFSSQSFATAFATSLPLSMAMDGGKLCGGAAASSLTVDVDQSCKRCIAVWMSSSVEWSLSRGDGNPDVPGVCAGTRRRVE